MKDDTGKVYDIEMQTAHYEDIARRSRYYQSMLDRSLLGKGHSYRELNDSYIIFIMLKDIFGLGYNVYEFESICTRGTGLTLNDVAKRIFVNAERVAADTSPELKNLILYILDGKTRDTLTERIEESVADAKIDPSVEGEFMTLYEMKEESYNEGMEEGMLVGRWEGILEAASKMIPILVENGYSTEEACDEIGVSLSEYVEYMECQ